MLNYLDVHPLMLPARYTDKVACFRKVYIISNIPLEEQYLSVQQNEPETWQAFSRRIHVSLDYLKNDKIELRTAKNGGLELCRTFESKEAVMAYFKQEVK